MGYRISYSTLIKIPLIFFVVSLIWIVGGDKLLFAATGHSKYTDAHTFQIWKGIIYVLVATVTVFYLLRRQQQTHLRSARQYRNLFHTNPNPILIFNTDTGRVMEVNNAAVKKYGYSKNEFLERTIHELYRTCDHAKLSYRLKHHTDDGTGSRWKHLKKSGRAFYVSVTSHKITFSGQDCIMLLAADINDTVLAEQKLSEIYAVEKLLNEELERNNEILLQSNRETRRLGEILNKTNNHVMITDKQGMITWVNEAFSTFTGYSIEEAGGKRSSCLLSGPETDPEVLYSLEEAIKRHEFFTSELINYTKEGKPYWVEITMSPIFDEKGNIDCYLAVENIINERKLKEKKIEAQNKALREIAWLSSHELRRPVTSIMGLSDLLPDASDETERNEQIALLKDASLELDNATRSIAHKIGEIERNHEHRDGHLISLPYAS